MIAFDKKTTLDAEASNRIREIVEEMELDGWNHSDTVPGCWDTRTVYVQDGVTLVFSRPMGTRVVRNNFVPS